MTNLKLPGSVKWIEIAPDYPALVVNHPAAKAQIALNGAHVMEWTPSGESPVLYMSREAELIPSKAIRGGIPICWPWFGPHPSVSTAPAHGFARARKWDLQRVEETHSGVSFEFTLNAEAGGIADWPHAFALKCIVNIGAELEVSLIVENTGSQSWKMSAALHTYLIVADIVRVSVSGLHGTQFVEGRLSPEKRPQKGPVLFDGEVDRLYTSDSTVEVTDPQGGRILVIEKSGSRSTVVWNPWIEKSKRLADLPNDAYFGFLCVEAANAGEDIVTVLPGGRHTLATRLRVRSLESGADAAREV